MNDILEILEKDARTTPEQIATMLNMSVEKVQETVEQLERDKVIIRYKTIVNWEKTGKEMVSALIEVKVSPQRDVGFDAVAERIYRFPEARSVYLVSGGYDLAVQVIGRSMQDVARFVTEKLAPLEGVHGTVTHFLLKRYKEDGDILGEDEEIQRLPISP
ncbi:MAG: Lrp/AsnC family transcriptional regulator [Chloroflexi bacterium]|nr:Lrp/AsnC family transcriptional regulator [Chloroflexota bacterium]